MRSNVLGPLRVLAAVAALSGCIAVVDFDYGGAGEGGAQGLAGSGGTPVTTGGGGAGGAGGATCASPDLETDRENCGTCGFSCGAASCEAGRCAASLSFKENISAAIVDDGYIYVVTAGQTPTFHVVPLDFTSTTSPSDAGLAINANGDFARGTVGTRHVYFASQEGNEIHPCAPSGCTSPDEGIPDVTTHINGMVPLGTTLYVMSSTPQNQIGHVEIDPGTGDPSIIYEPFVTTIDSIAGDGLRDLRLLPGSPDRLLFNSSAVDGCLYAVGLDDTSGSAECASPAIDILRFVVTPDGRIVAGSASSIFTLDASTFQPAPLSDEMRSPLAADDTFAYAVSTAVEARLLAKRLDGAGAAVELPLASGAVSAIDASDPRYVVYAGGTKLLRQPKPAP